jgi:hypothetical protein
MYYKFWAKTLLHLVTPGGYGYHRTLRRHYDPGYVHERDKHPVRRKHQGSSGWQQSRQSTVLYRDYASYDEYTEHQRQKFDEILKMSGGFSNKVVVGYRLKFYRRFRHLSSILPYDARIVCAGARQGTEVDVLRDLGFRNAYGIDLNPGPENPLVRLGDFMHMSEATSSVDLIYTNCVDHAFSLDDFFAEHARVITDGGYALYDLRMSEGMAGPFESVAWRNDEDVFLMMLRYFKTVLRVEVDSNWKWILLQGKRVTVPKAGG